MRYHSQERIEQLKATKKAMLDAFASGLLYDGLEYFFYRRIAALPLVLKILLALAALGRIFEDDGTRGDR